MEEENNYFKTIVKDALSDLKYKKNACVFYEEQVEAVRNQFKGEIKVIEKDDFFYLTVIENYDKM